MDNTKLGDGARKRGASGHQQGITLWTTLLYNKDFKNGWSTNSMNLKPISYLFQINEGKKIVHDEFKKTWTFYL